MRLLDVQRYLTDRDPVALGTAKQIFDLVVSGWDSDPKHASPGGTFWIQASWSTDRNTVSNMPAAELGVRLYQITGTTSYLDWALRMYHWTNHNLRRPDGLYSDHLDRAGTIEPAVWSYNQGVPIDVNVSALPGNARSEIPGGGPAHRLCRHGPLRHQGGNLYPAGLLQFDLFQESHAARIGHRWLDLSPGDAVLRRQRLDCEPGCRDRAVPLRRRSHPGHRPGRDGADLRRSGMGPTAAAFTALSTVTVREVLEIRATEQKS